MKYVGTGSYYKFVEQMNSVFFALNNARVVGKNIKSNSLVKIENSILVISIK